MSLSHDILESNMASIERRIKLGASVNDFDAYGYTPLIMALMTGQPECAAFLLRHGADANKPDIFGQPPLHWAIKMESVTLCKMLLERTAFPNTLSSYGEPLLVYPLLRKNHELIDVLTQAGTDRNCAQDYIFIKYLGHHFELQGFGLFRNYNNLISLVDYQGFRLEFSVSQMMRQYETYLDVHPDKRKLPQSMAISEALHRSERLRAVKKALPSEQESTFSQHLGALNVLPMAFDGHAVCLAYSGRFIATSDRAQNRSETVVFYKAPKELSPEQTHFLLYGKKTRDFWNELPHLLHLFKIASLPITHQKVGNCSWANFEPAPILLEGLLMLTEDRFHLQELMHHWEHWHQWSENYLIKESLLRHQKLSGDRKLCYTMALLDIVLQHPPTEHHDLIMAQLARSGTLLDRLYEQHQINNSPFLASFTKLMRNKSSLGPS